MAGAAPIQKISSDTLLKLLAQQGLVLTDRRLRQLAKEGFFPDPIKSQYVFLPTLLGLIHYYHALREKQGGGLAAEKLRTARADRRIKEVDAAKAEDSVEDIGEVERARVALVMLVRQRLLGLPAKLSPRLAAYHTQPQIQSALEKELEEILHQLAQPAFIARPDPESEDGADQ